MSQHLFSEIPRIDVPRSVFNRNHNLKTTIGTDYLYPIYVDEALPADTFKFRQHLFGRLSTPMVPIMDNLYLDTFYFAVPIRLIDKNWQKFMGERPFGDTTTVYETPVLSTGTSGVPVGSLSDYIGIPTDVPNLEFCSYWHRAYNLIYNEWFRDENLCQPRPVAGVAYDGTSTGEPLSDYQLVRRCKRHDYFTSCLPWPQKGDAVGINLGGNANVFATGSLELTDGKLDRYLAHPRINSTSTTSWAGYPLIATSDTPNIGDYSSVAGSVQYLGNNVGVGYKSGLSVDLSSATGISINALREALALQKFLEIDARSGTRYIEILRGHFGVISPDARMQRPEYLGGSSVPLNVNTVAQTSSTDSTSPQGNLAAFVTVGHECGWTKSFTEHCIIIGLANIRADLSYQQGLPRMFSRRSRYDFYWPQLANLGEQAVLNKEIYAQGTSDDDEVFGYQERWAEYRYHPNTITGQFRSTYSQSLDVWHLAQKFDSLPTLSNDFIEEHVPIDRVVAIQSEPPMILDGWFECNCARPMPLYSVPSLGNRF